MNFIKRWVAQRIIKEVLNMSFLSGYKTYICAAAIGVLTGLHYAGVIDQTLYQTLVGLFGAGGLASLRAGVSK